MRHWIRFGTSTFSLWLVTLVIPGFNVYHVHIAVLIGIIIALIGWIIESLFQGEISPFAHAVIGFFISAGVLILSSITPFLSGNVLGVLIVSLFIGMVDL